MRNILSSSRRPAFAAAVASAIIFLSACANGPSDFLSPNAAPDGGDKPPIRSLAERQELANSLETEARKSAAAASTDAGTSVREMEALRQGQNHQAERLRAAATADRAVAGADECGAAAAAAGPAPWHPSMPGSVERPIVPDSCPPQVS